MIKVRIDLVPFGTGKPRHLGTMHIANDGTGSETEGNYNVKMFSASGHRMENRDARVERHKRKSLSVWYLVKKALEAAGFI